MDRHFAFISEYVFPKIKESSATTILPRIGIISVHSVKCYSPPIVTHRKTYSIYLPNAEEIYSPSKCLKACACRFQATNENQCSLMK